VDFCQGGTGIVGEVHTGVCLTLIRVPCRTDRCLNHELANLWPIIIAPEEDW